MPRSELIRMRRAMYRRIRETVAERRLAAILHPVDHPDPVGAADKTADTDHH